MIKKEIVKNLHVPVGYHCNNFCLFCMEADRVKRYVETKEFVKERVYDFLRRNRKMKKVIFTSGEPTLNPDLLKYIRHTKKLGFETISIISNGRMYSNEKFCLDLLKRGANEFIVSIHGHKKEIHDALTRTPGSFGQTAKGLDNLSRIKKYIPFHLTISVVINKINCEFLGNMLDFLRKYRADEIVFNIVQPVGLNMEKRFRILMPRYGEVAKIFENLLREKPWLFEHPQKLETRRYVSITDLPPCSSEKMIDMIGFGEERIIDCEGKTKKEHTSAHKEKRKACQSCGYSRICDGVYKNYIKNFGWEEFTPVKRTKKL
ncbi:MAG: radical SAM protein [Candidatus Moranbacteria bacterium]|nr:radical SAM protein [Candidatus Moranbacteria bacterium]